MTGSGHVRMHGNRRMAGRCVADHKADAWQERQRRRSPVESRALERRCASPKSSLERQQTSTCAGEESTPRLSRKRNEEIPETAPQTQRCRCDLAFIRETFQPTKSAVRGSVAVGGKQTRKHQVQVFSSTQTVLLLGCLQLVCNRIDGHGRTVS